jgi:branched-subunit amino acid ABC-type transport system permease component
MGSGTLRSENTILDPVIALALGVLTALIGLAMIAWPDRIRSLSFPDWWRSPERPFVLRDNTYRLSPYWSGLILIGSTVAVVAVSNLGRQYRGRAVQRRASQCSRARMLRWVAPAAGVTPSSAQS